MTLRVQLSTSEHSGLGMLVKFVADPVVWWQLSSSRVTRTQTRTLPKPATVYTDSMSQLRLGQERDDLPPTSPQRRLVNYRDEPVPTITE